MANMRLKIIAAKEVTSRFTVRFKSGVTRQQPASQSATTLSTIRCAAY